MQVADKEWDKYRVAFVLQGKPHYVDEDDKTINTKVDPLTKALALLCLESADVTPRVPGVQRYRGAGPGPAERPALDRTRTHQ